jgi:hypothetical protein
MWKTCSTGTFDPRDLDLVADDGVSVFVFSLLVSGAFFLEGAITES